MSRRRERAELQESLKELERNDLQDVVKVQQYVVGVTMGQYPFEHPNGPKITPGTRYMPNQTEIDFTQRTRTSLYSNFFRCAFVGAFTPYITLRVFSLMQKRVIPTQRYMIWSSLGGGFGAMYGMTLGRISVAREYLRLENSPLATEARYQLWKLNPSHPFLKGFEHETNEWNEYSFRDSRDTYDDNINDTNYNDYRYSNKPMNNDNDIDRNYRDYYDRNNRNRNRDRDRDRNRNTRNDDIYDDYDEERIRRKKRDRFYQTRDRINNNNFDDTNDPYDQNDFFDSSQMNGNSPNDDVSQFFEGGNKQKWD